MKWSYPLAATDGDPLTWSVVKGPADMTLEPNTTTLNWWVTSADVGTYEIEVKVDDGRGGSDTQAFTLAISGQ